MNPVSYIILCLIVIVGFVSTNLHIDAMWEDMQSKLKDKDSKP